MSGSLFLTGCYITEQSWLFLFNVGLGVHLQLARQQWTGDDFDWNNIINASPDKVYSHKKRFTSNLFLLFISYILESVTAY